MDGSVLGEKSSLKMLGLAVFKIRLGLLHYIYIAKTTPKKSGALICSMKFLFPEVALSLYETTIW